MEIYNCAYANKGHQNHGGIKPNLSYQSYLLKIFFSFC